MRKHLFAKSLVEKIWKEKFHARPLLIFITRRRLRRKWGTRSATDLLWVPLANVNHLIASWKTGKARGIRQSTKIILFFLFFYLSMTVFCILGLSYAHLLLDYYNYAIKQWIFKFLGTSWMPLRSRLDFLIFIFYFSSKKFKNYLLDFEY